MKKIFLSDLDSCNKIQEEEASEWVRAVILAIGLDEKIVFGHNKAKAVEYLIQNKVFIDFNIKNKSIKITKDGQTIGEWKDILVSTKIEDGIPFAEITVDVWSVIDKKQTPGKNNE